MKKNKYTFKKNRKQILMHRRIILIISLLVVIFAITSFIRNVIIKGETVASTGDIEIKNVNGILNTPLISTTDKKVLLDNSNYNNTKVVPKTESIDDYTSDNIQQEKKSVEKTEAITFGTQVLETEPVGVEYFDDALFIGNSHTEGVTAYSAMDNATVYAAKGIMVDTIFTKEVIKNSTGTRVTIFDAMTGQKFGKIYVLLGANELGWAYSDEFIKQYGKVVDKIKEIQPEAKIYIQSILPVTAKKSSEDKIYNNVNIKKYNELILAMCKEKQVYFVNILEAVVDEKGNLPDDVAKDGMHFGKKYYTKWFDYLKTHTVK